MLKQPLPGTLRRRAGAALLVVVIGSAGYACWAAQSAVDPARIHTAALAGAPIAMHMKWIINDADVAPAKRAEVTRKRTIMVVNVVAPAGSPVKLFNSEKTFEALCTPTLPDSADKQHDTILVKCTLSDHGRVLGTPSLLIADGTTGALEVGDVGRPHLSRLEINASTKPRNVAAVSEDEAGSAEDPDDAGDAPEMDDVDVPDVPEPPDADDAVAPPAPPELPAPAARAPGIAPPAPAVAPAVPSRPI